jgi:hypothetical protein
MGEGARLEPQRALVTALADLLGGDREAACEVLETGWR